MGMRGKFEEDLELELELLLSEEGVAGEWLVEGQHVGNGLFGVLLVDEGLTGQVGGFVWADLIQVSARLFELFGYEIEHT